MASNLKIFIAAVLIGSLLILAPVSQASISYTYATLGSPNAPNGYGTAATGINDSGQVSGYFYSATRSFQGFIATPSKVPVPSAIWLFGSGLGLLSFNRRKIKVIQ